LDAARLIARLARIGLPSACAVPVAVAVAATPQPVSTATRIGVRGAGVVTIGMTVREAEAATGQDFVPLGEPSPGSDCSYVRVTGVTRSLAFMLKGQRIVRVDVGPPRGTNATTRGIRRGHSEAAVKRAYRGRIRVAPHHYVPRGHELIYAPAERSLRNRRIVFETDGRKVTYIRAGRLPEVRYIEGCS
jgi:hypothetical protein